MESSRNVVWDALGSIHRDDSRDSLKRGKTKIWKFVSYGIMINPSVKPKANRILIANNPFTSTLDERRQQTNQLVNSFFLLLLNGRTFKMH